MCKRVLGSNQLALNLGRQSDPSCALCASTRAHGGPTGRTGLKVFRQGGMTELAQKLPSQVGLDVCITTEVANKGCATGQHGVITKASTTRLEFSLAVAWTAS